MLKKDTNKIKYSMKYTVAPYLEIIIKYEGLDCSHPNKPYEACDGCGLPGCYFKRDDWWDS